MENLVRFAILGVGAGGVIALLGAGLVISYRASAVINFAYGGIAMAAAYLYWELHVNYGLPTALSMILATVFGAILGIVIYYVLLRPLRRASQTTRMLSTLGVMVALQGAASLRYQNAISVPSQFPSTSINILGAPIGVDRIILLAITAGVADATIYHLPLHSVRHANHSGFGEFLRCRIDGDCCRGGQHGQLGA